MTFIDTPCRFDVKATCTNRKCNISEFGSPTSGYTKLLWSHLIGHPRLMGVSLMTFIHIPYRLAVKATCTNRKCNISVFEGPTSGFEKNYGLHRVTIEASPNSEKRLGK